MSYPSFPSIERLENVYCIITEKIDGTNGLVEIHKAGSGCSSLQCTAFPCDVKDCDKEPDNLIIKFGSRNRYITYENDNAGFVNFFRHYKEKFKDVATDIITKEKELAGETLTECQEQYPIRIYGEWFGSGIQRGYGLKDKFFMPFSTYYAEKLIKYDIPNIIDPFVIYKGKFSESITQGYIESLKYCGSQIVPNYMKPEGVVIYFPKYNMRLKKIIEYPELPKKKTDHDIKPELHVCKSCGKRLYTIKDGSGNFKCMNIYCKESPNYKE